MTSPKESRISERIPAEFKVNYIHEGDYLISHSKNISVDGMFLFTENPPPVSTHTKLEFSIGDLENIEINAEVVWVNNASSQDLGMAVKFLNLDQEIKDAILKTINKVAVLTD